MVIKKSDRARLRATEIMISSSSNSFRVYFNGIESTTGPIADSGTLSFDIISEDLNGIIDEVAIWTSITGTNTHAVQLSNWDAADTVISNPSIYYKMNESGTATVAPDSSGNENHGTLLGFPSSGMWVPFV